MTLLPARCYVLEEELAEELRLLDRLRHPDNRAQVTARVEELKGRIASERGGWYTNLDWEPNA